MTYPDIHLIQYWMVIITFYYLIEELPAFTLSTMMYNGELAADS